MAVGKVMAGMSYLESSFNWQTSPQMHHSWYGTSHDSFTVVTYRKNSPQVDLAISSRTPGPPSFMSTESYRYSNSGDNIGKSLAPLREADDSHLELSINT